jgi:exodeoxyribonuclease VII large subunit
MNKELPLPRLLQRVAVISSASAAGYGDFCNQLTGNVRGLCFRTKLFPAVMQGDGVEASVIAALNAIAAEMDEWDAVVIIRGGGSTSDLAGFDTLALAENVAQFPLPVITGIGHERDDTVIDVVAHTRVKTPTAAAEFLIHHQEAELDLVERLADRLTSACRQVLHAEQVRHQRICAKLPSLFSAFRLREENRLERLMGAAANGAVRYVERRKSVVEMFAQRLEQSAKTMLVKENHRLVRIADKAELASPERVLRLGYSITRINGHAVTDASGVKAGDTIVTTLANGEITSEVKR